MFFVLQNAICQPLKLPDVAVRSLGTHSGKDSSVLPIDLTWLRLTLKQGPSGIAGACAFKDELFDAEHFPALDRGLQSDPGQSGNQPEYVTWPIGRDDR